MDRDDYLQGWSRLHRDLDPRGNRLVLWWLGWTWTLARPLAARRVPPDAVTALAVATSAGAVGAAAAGGGWLLLAAALVVVSGQLDSLDGAVAVLTGRSSRWGSVLDSASDRVSDLLFAGSLLVAGAHAWVAVLGGVLSVLLEYVRSQAVAAGLRGVGVVTVWERPTRVIVTAAFLASGAAWRDPTWAQLGAAAWVGLGAVGLVQLTVVVRRALGAPPA